MKAMLSAIGPAVLVGCFFWTMPSSAGGGDAGGKLVLVEQGVSQVPIVVAEDALTATVRAAEELATYIEKTSGARPDVIHGNPDPVPTRAIWVGYQPKLNELFPVVRFSFERPEEILIVAGASHLAIVGRDRTVGDIQTEYGTANAVYTFIQEYLQVRWLWPGELGEDVLPQKTIACAPFEYRYAPPFRQRATVFLRSTMDSRRGLSHDWTRLQRLQLDSFVSHAGGHAFVDWWERFHEDHPDYFALQPDGTRSAYPDPETVKLCQSNPAVWDQWLADAVAMIERGEYRYHGPSARPVNVIPASPNDSHSSGQCVCENCRAWDHPNGAPWRYYYRDRSLDYVAMTDRYITFWNHLAAKLKERYPDRDILVGVSAYGPSMPPPVAARLAENTVLRYVGHFPFTTEVSRAEQKAQWLEWAKTAPHMLYRPNLWYWGGGLWGWPEVAMTKTAEDFRFLAENRCMGLAVDTVWEHWATQGPQYYIMAHLAWNPYCDHQAVLADYYRRGFGKAAEEIAEYWGMMEEARDRLMASPDLQLGSRYRLTVITAAEQVYTQEFLKRADALLQQAAAKVASEPEIYAKRVAFGRAGFDVFRLMIECIPLMKRVRESGGKDAEAVRQALANWQRMEAISRQAGPHAFNFSFILARMRGGYMGGVEDYLGPPSEKFQEAAGLR
jgi:hypothetical protein